MPTAEELHATDQRPAAPVAELRPGRAEILALQNEMRDLRASTDKGIRGLDKTISEIRGALGELATKDDIDGLRDDLRERLDRDELLDEKIALVRGQVDEIRTAKENRFNRRMSWGMLFLFVVDVVLVALTVKHG